MNSDPNLIIFYIVFADLGSVSDKLKQNYQQKHNWWNIMENTFSPDLSKGLALGGGGTILRPAPL